MSTPPQLTPVLNERFRDFQTADCDARVRAEIERIVREGSDIDCYKINAARIAGTCGVSVREALRAFLFATQLGILDLNYDTYCPSCSGNTEYARHLMGLRSRGSCDLCSIEFENGFLDQVEVTFTVNPNVRGVTVPDFWERDFDGKVAYFKQIVQREGRVPVLSSWFQPGEQKTIDGRLDDPAGYIYYLASNHLAGGLIEISGEPTEELRTVALTVNEDGSVTPNRLELAPGPIAFAVDYRYHKRWPVLTMRRGLPNNWVSAAYVTSQQDFRDLFAGEFLAPGVSFAIRNTTLMFTDIKQSTELFEELGDSAAYALIQDHFRVMADIIRNHQGGIVKTIGDAVMAAFPVNRDAVAAACDIQQAFSQAPIKNRFIAVKIGLHRGAAIAVTSNRNLDYFGRTVNIAARVQGKSAANQVLLSDAVIDDPQVQELLAARPVTRESFTTGLKGLGDSFRLHAVDRQTQDA